MKSLYRIAVAVGLLGFAGLPAIALPDGTAGPTRPPKAAGSDKTPKPGDAQGGKSPAAKGGRDRWAIKTASDAEAQEINATPSMSTVEKLLAIPRPLDMAPDGSNAFFQQHRARPAETTVFSVEADVVDCRLMPDGDYRVTLRGVSGKTMVLEIPNTGPEFVDPNSKFASQLKAARTQFEGRFKPETTSKPVQGHARITGVGFFGRTYGGRNADGNLIQLHPVLNVEWLDKPSADFTAAPDGPSKTTPEVKPAPAKSSTGKPAPGKPTKKTGAPKRKPTG